MACGGGGGRVGGDGRYTAGMRPLRYSIHMTLDECCDHRAIPRDREAGLATVVGGGFRVDEDAGDLGVVEAEFAFEVGDDLVDGFHGHVVGKGDVAVDLDAGGGAAVAAGEGDLVDVQDFGEVAGGGAELAL